MSPVAAVNTFCRFDEVRMETIEINRFLQGELARKGIDEVSAVEAASWLDRSGLLADRPERRGATLRALLRRGEIDGAVQRPPRRHGSWFVTLRREPKGAFRSVSSGATGDVLTTRDDDLTENDVVDAVCAFLEQHGWQIRTRATTIQHGPDIEAESGRQEIVVEAKGATSSNTATRRYGKPFNPSQVRVHVARAFCTAAAEYGSGGRWSAMAFPDTPSHRKRVAGIEPAVKSLGIGIFWVDAERQVQLVAPWELSQSPRASLGD